MSQIILRDLYCEKCSLQFDKKYVFDIHLDMIHGEEIIVKKEPLIKAENFEELQQPFKCSICDTNFLYKQRLNGQIATIHEGKKPFRQHLWF